MMRCLIIDNSPLIRRVARAIIESFGLDVREAANCRQAFELCVVDMPDVILLDWRARGMSAHKFMKALAAYGPQSWPFIFYCTTELDYLDMRHAGAAGAADVIVKPFDRNTLSAKFARFNDVLAMRALAMTPPDQPWPASQLDDLEALVLP